MPSSRKKLNPKVLSSLKKDIAMMKEEKDRLSKKEIKEADEEEQLLKDIAENAMEIEPKKHGSKKEVFVRKGKDGKYQIVYYTCRDLDDFKRICLKELRWDIDVHKVHVVSKRGGKEIINDDDLKALRTSDMLTFIPE